MKRFNLVVCGGTFDHFHKGHESFLRFILSLSNKIILGLTTAEYIRNKKLSNSIESYSKRKKSIEEFFRKENALYRLEIEPIDNLFIPKKWESLRIDAIVVSNDTQKGAEIINRERKKRGLSQLKVIVAPIIFADSNSELSSFRIRNGEINREGKLYVKDLWFKKDLKLPQDLRKELQKPFGELLKDVNDLSKDKDNLVITVGDITTKVFNEKSLGQDISVIDFKVAREKKFYSILELGFKGDERILTVDNPAGYITSNLFKAILQIFKSDMKRRIILQVNGEEDLTVLPLVLLSPLNTIIYYGQRDLGLVKIFVSENAKEKAYNLALKLKTV